MINLVRSELLKLSLTRATWGILVVGLALSVARVAMILRGVGIIDGVSRGTAEATVSMVSAGGLGTTVVVLLGAVAVTTEYRHATLTVSFLVTPDRRRLLIAKSLLFVVIGPAVALSMMAVGLGYGLLTGVAAHPDGTLVRPVLGACLAAVFLGWFGVGLGALIRNQTAAVAVPLVWLVFLEPLAPAYGWRVLAVWLPGNLLGTLGAPHLPGTPATWVAALVLTGIGSALFLLGLHRLVRHDIT